VHRHALITQRGQHRVADAAVRIVVLHRDHPSAGGAGAFDERLAVDRLDAEEIDHADRDAFRLELLVRFERLEQGDAGRNHRGAIVGALPQHLGFPDFEALAGFIDHRRGGTAGADIEHP
jgi:hypothetical protein